MTTLELLRQRAGELASQLDKADDKQLRRLAAAIARVATERTGLRHPVIAQALAYLSASPSSHSQLRARVQALAEELDSLTST